MEIFLQVLWAVQACTNLGLCKIFEWSIQGIYQFILYHQIVYWCIRQYKHLTAFTTDCACINANIINMSRFHENLLMLPLIYKLYFGRFPRAKIIL